MTCLKVLLLFKMFLFAPASSTIFNASNTQEFVDALDLINAGDKIFLQPGIYRGDFVLPELGPAKSHTLITSATQNASSVVFAGRGKDTPLIVNGTKWALTKFTITNQHGSDLGMGLMLKMDQAFVKGLIIRDVDMAVSSEGNNAVLQDCEIHATQMGIYVSGNRTIVKGNRIYDVNPCIFVDDIACCGTVMDNQCSKKGAVFVNGANYKMDAKTKQENELNKVLN